MLKILGTLIIKGLLKVATFFAPTPAAKSLWMWGPNSFGQLGDNTTTNRSSPVQTITFGTDWKQIDCAVGYYTTAIKNDGTLWAWGYNGFGQLGDNTTTQRQSPVQTIALGTNWKQVSGGYLYTAAVKNDGTLWCWGRNESGQLGDNSNTSTSSPIQTIAGSTNWKQVSCGGSNTAAIKTDGTLWCWGVNNIGQLGDNTTISKSSPVQTIALGTNWKQVSCGSDHTAAVKTDGTLWVWGGNYPNGSLGDNTIINKSSPVQAITFGSNWDQVSCSFTLTAAVKTDGTLWCWGSNMFGSLGDNTTTNRSSPVQTVAYGTDWKQVDCGNGQVASIKTDGTLWTWGYNSNGELGDNTTIHRSSPVQTIADGITWTDVSAGRCTGAIYQAATTTPAPSGSLWLWGLNTSGQLGDNTAIAIRSSPVQTIAYGTDWKQIACAYSHTAAIKNDGRLWMWGFNYSGQLGDNTIIYRSSPVQTIAGGTDWKQVSGGGGHTAAIKTDGTLWVWGENTFGQIGDNTMTNRSSPIQTIAGGINWIQVSCGSNHTAAVKTDGTLWVWGLNNFAQLGDNSSNFKLSPVQTDAGGNNWKQVSCGFIHTAAIKTDGTLWVWGDNSYGELGDETNISMSSPVQTVTYGNDWKQVSCSDLQTSAIKNDGTLWCWGRNTSGEIGDNTNIDKSSPVQTIALGTNWKKVSSGNFFTTAIKTDGTLWVWGINGVLGTNDSIPRSSPVQTIAYGNNWIDVSAFGEFAGAIYAETTTTPAPSGSLWSWGLNSYGQLGDNTITKKSSPVQTIAGGTNWIKLSQGYTALLTGAIKTDGTLWLWGKNLGSIGDNTTINRSSPIQTISYGTNWKEVSCGTTSTVAIKNDGTLWGWGYNQVGQLGDGSSGFAAGVDKSSPVQTIAGGTNWNQVSCSGNHTAAIKTDGTLWLWGYNFHGQLGQNSIANKSSPIQIISFGTDWKQVSCGGYHTFSIKTDGTLWGFGYNNRGQLGDNTITDKSSPVQTISYGTNWKQVSCGYDYTAAIKTDGTLWCWGYNNNGLLGDNTTTDKSSPVQTISYGTNWKKVSAGYAITAGIKTDGTLWIWGKNTDGALGDNTAINKSSPVQTITNGTNWIDVLATGSVYGIKSS